MRRSKTLGNLSTRRSRHHRRQAEVFLQHDSHCPCQDVLELRSRTSKRKFSGWNQRFKFWVLRRVFGIQRQKFFVWNPVLFVRKKKNLTQIFERHFQLNYSVSVRDGFTLFCLIICILHANRVPDPVLRGQPCCSWIKNVWCLNSCFCLKTPSVSKRCLVWSHWYYNSFFILMRLRASSPIWANEASRARGRSLARSRETRFARPNRRACSQAMYTWSS